MTRFFDICFSFLGLLVFSPVFLFLIIIGLFDTGYPLFRQMRMGKGEKPFYLYKFRSMKLNTPSIATHYANSSSITKFGAFLRKSKLDELPQLFNVLVGDMSLVGPRPNLLNQLELVQERSNLHVYKVRPGITGLAQINKIDMSKPKLLAQMDAKMIREFNTYKYFKFILLTVFGRGFGDRIIVK